MTAPIADTRQAGGPSGADLAGTYGRYRDPAAGSGWVVFAGAMIAIAGCLNVVDGIAAIGNSKVFRGHGEILVSNLKTWGWIVLILGVFEICVAIGIWAGKEAARWIGVGVAGLNAIGQLLFASHYPIWSLVIVGFDVLVIYGLLVHGRESAIE
jgi:hypothetical protein